MTKYPDNIITPASPLSQHSSLFPNSPLYSVRNSGVFEFKKPLKDQCQIIASSRTSVMNLRTQNSKLTQSLKV